MAKYYCDYCKSYLTHDSLSVRKSHLIGKNHLKFYCDFYEKRQKRERKKLIKKNKIVKNNTPLYEYDAQEHYKGIPGLPEPKEEVAVFPNTSTPSGAYNNNNTFSRSFANSATTVNSTALASYPLTNEKPYDIPMPPSTYGLPGPPPSVYYYKIQDERKKITNVINEKRRQERAERIR